MKDGAIDANILRHRHFVFITRQLKLYTGAEYTDPNGSFIENICLHHVSEY